MAASISAHAAEDWKSQLDKATDAFFDEAYFPLMLRPLRRRPVSTSTTRSWRTSLARMWMLKL